jgi:hypothetical protein
MLILEVGFVVALEFGGVNELSLFKIWMFGREVNGMERVGSVPVYAVNECATLVDTETELLSGYSAVVSELLEIKLALAESMLYPLYATHVYFPNTSFSFLRFALVTFMTRSPPSPTWYSLELTVSMGIPW